MRLALAFIAWLAGVGLWAQNGKPAVQIAVTDISCNGKADARIELTLLNGALPVGFQWANLNTGALGVGQFTTLNQPLVLPGLAAGLYQFNFTGANGADTSMQRLVVDPLPVQGALVLLTNFGGFQVTCSNGSDGKVLLNATGGTPPLTYLWSNGDNGVRADSLPAGPVSVTVTDARGCQWAADTALQAPPPIHTVLDAEGETCLGQNTGRISVESVSGGVPPYRFALNDDPSGNILSWTDLPYGQYFLYTEDAIGCVHTDGIILPSGLEFTLKLGNDTSMLSGDTLRLAFYIDPPADTLLWQPGAGVQMLSGSEALLFPAYSTTYHVTAVSADGCLAEDDIRVTVSRHRDVYVPNVFAPQAQEADNRMFTVFGGGGIRSVALLQVFDRFGRQWFEGRNFPVNDITSGWNGAFGSDEAPVGVYLWRAVLEYTDGREERLQGDVTLVR